MSKMFTLKPYAIDEYHANEYSKTTKNAPHYKYYPDGEKEGKFFGYCTGGCGLKVFLSKPTKEGGDYFFKHHKGYYSDLELIKMESCNNYKPSKGQKTQPIALPPEYLDEIFDFLRKYAYFVYGYINEYVLKRIGYMTSDFFIELIEDIFVTHVKTLSTSDRISIKMLPYNILYLMYGSGRMDFSLIKKRKINFKPFEKELKMQEIDFYNYFLFLYTDEYFNEDCIGLEVIKSEDWGKKLEKPILRYQKKIKIDNHGLMKFINDKSSFVHIYKMNENEIINKYKDTSDAILNYRKEYHKITDKINELLA